jgi:glyoxylase-like metal-dependent hydrolase (beta-lactamase superfamily II)
MRSMLNIRLREETAVRQIERLGSPADVRHILPTHLDFDHAGGLEDLPGAMPESPSTPAAAGCSTPATPISIAARCAARNAAARRPARQPDDDGGRPGEPDGESGTLRRLSLDAAAQVRIVCAHDAVELERCAAEAPL